MLTKYLAAAPADHSKQKQHKYPCNACNSLHRQTINNESHASGYAANACASYFLSDAYMRTVVMRAESLMQLCTTITAWCATLFLNTEHTSCSFNGSHAYSLILSYDAPERHSGRHQPDTHAQMLAQSEHHARKSFFFNLCWFPQHHCLKQPLASAAGPSLQHYQQHLQQHRRASQLVHSSLLQANLSWQVDHILLQAQV